MKSVFFRIYDPKKFAAINPIKIKKITKTTDHELLNNLNEKKMLEEEVLSGIPGYHRYVFGVSHSDLHRASPNTTVIYCGAGTMFSIGDPESRTNHFQTINSALKTVSPSFL